MNPSTDMKAPDQQPTTAPAIGSAGDMVPVLLPGWFVRYYEALCRHFGSQESLSDYIMVMLDDEIQESLDANSGEVKGIAQAVVEDSQNEIQRRARRMGSIISQAKFEMELANAQKGGPEA